MPIAVTYIAAIMLFIGAAPMPYGYYTLLRIVACVVFGIAATIALKRKHQLLPWAYLLLALAFNPIIKVHFSKEVWMLIDIGAGILLLATANAIKDRA